MVMNLSNFFKQLLCYTTAISILSVSIFEVIWNVPENRCGMTWMYEWPEYIKVDLPTHIQRNYPKYSLYIYGEGGYADYLKSMNGDYKLNGVPVVFVHGNAGRYKQVRSPASVSLRKSDTKVHHFNYFTVDYEEELSALHGPYLQQQTEYLAHCITTILQCYSHLKDKPESIIAIGHSMGGLVIRGLFTLPHFDSSLINLVVNLATPQREPIISLDPALYTYYRSVNEFWYEHSSTILQNVSFISLGGGVRDYLVRSDLCSMSDISTNKNHLSLLTTSVPLVWRSTDHQCIVWCNELVRLETRLFFEMIDGETGFITKDLDLRNRLLRKHFQPGQLENHIMKEPKKCLEIYATKKIILINSRNHNCIRLLNEEGDKTDKLHSVDILLQGVLSDWIYECMNQKSYCHASNASYNLLEHDGVKSMFTSLDISQKKTFILQVMRNAKLRLQLVQTHPVELKLPILFPKNIDIEHHAFHVKFSLPSFTESWQVYDVVVHAKQKSILGSYQVTWSGEREFFTFDASNSLFRMKLFHKKRSTALNNDTILLEFWRDDLNGTRVTLQPNILGTLGQLLRFNLEHIVRLVLLFGMMYMLLSGMGTKGLMADFNIEIKKTQFVIMFLLLLKVVAVLCTSSGLTPTHLRQVVPLTYTIVISLLITSLLRVSIKIIFQIITFISYPVLVVCRLLQPILCRDIYIFHTMGICFNYWSISTLLLVVAYYMKKINISLILMLLLYYHILKIKTTDKDSEKEKHINVLIGVSPVIVTFNAVHVITLVKDFMQGFPSLSTEFLNIQVLTLCYAIYLFLDIQNGDNTLTNKFINCMTFVFKCFSFLLVILCLFSYVPLYWITYVLSYILLVINVFA